jgi:hypothetical protein
LPHRARPLVLRLCREGLAGRCLRGQCQLVLTPVSTSDPVSRGWLGRHQTRLTCGTRDSQHSDPAWLPRRDDSTSGSGWSARSTARTNDLGADVGRRDDETVPERWRSSAFHCGPLGSPARTRVRTPRLTSVHGALSGDMMVDGVIPTRRSCGRSFFGGCPGCENLASIRVAGADRRSSL